MRLKDNEFKNRTKQYSIIMSAERLGGDKVQSGHRMHECQYQIWLARQQQPSCFWILDWHPKNAAPARCKGRRNLPCVRPSAAPVAITYLTLLMLYRALSSSYFKRSNKFSCLILIVRLIYKTFKKNHKSRVKYYSCFII